MSESLILILAFLILCAIVCFSLKPITGSKPAPIKKDELIQKYEDEMREILHKYKDDSINLQKKKIEYLKLSSHQLHNNIFFDAKEAKEIIKNWQVYNMEDLDLISLEYKDIFDENKDKKIEFSKDLLPKPYNLNSLFVVKVDGKSMQPVINDRALVISDLSQKEIINDSIYLIYKEDKMWIKKALISNSKTKFISINSDYSHLVYDLKEVHVVAKVLLTFTSF